MKQTASRVIAWVVLVLSLTIFSATGVLAQEPQVEQKGNVFIAKKSSRGNGACTKTNYLYEDSKGRIDTIYLSSTGKAFVWRVSKNGNAYKKYLPEVTKKLNPQAYEKGKSD